jgi:acetylornithine deacetylase/succinyl-diaminopimelate desuccinylase-like protein
MTSLHDTQAIEAVASSAAFAHDLTNLLVRLCQIDTTPRPDVADLAKAEHQCFAIIRQEIDGSGLDHARVREAAIDAAIADHPFYSNPTYTRTDSRPMLASAETYADRCNLLLEVDGAQSGEDGIHLALNGHVDVVHPYIPPRVDGRTVFGRGACDDKGPVVSILAALRLVAEHLERHRLRLNRHLTVMFVIEEEMGGNGSLSLALDRALRRRYDSVAVLECTSSNIHPGNRGAVWYKVEAQLDGVHLFEAAAFIVGAMEDEGAKIKAESDHSLFPHRPVQTCHGMIGLYGEHPSRICGEVCFDVVTDGRAASFERVVAEQIEAAVAEYVERYGDKTRAEDQQTSRPKVDHHYDLESTDTGLTVRVWGSTGHMGSILENDGAITKMATIVRRLVDHRLALEQAAGGAVHCRLHDWDDPSRLVMEGGQGFLPTHTMDDVQRRLRDAAEQGAQDYFVRMGLSARACDTVAVTYEKLHNAAFAGPADSATLLTAIAAAKQAGIWPADRQIRGWDVSCDARIFACEYPQLSVITMGPGHLRHAHADDEQLDIGELVQFSQFLALFILQQCGTVKVG